MPVQKFRDLESAARALWTTSSDPQLARRIRLLWAFGARLCPRRVPVGVRRFRSIDEAQHERATWTIDRR